MSPSAGARLVAWAGDWITFTLHHTPEGCTARLRTTLGRAEVIRREIVSVGAAHSPAVSAGWHDVPLRRRADGGWEITLPLTEVGWFEAKAFALDASGRQHWPAGPNVGISVQPSWTRSGNSIYCAFPRQFGPSRTLRVTADPLLDEELRKLDTAKYAVIPPSGKLRDVRRELPHIFQTLGCRILHLLPVNPTPTTFARFGRFGSPYAAQDLTAIDPALVEFDRQTTGVQQFEELTHSVQCLGGRVMLDMVINHTGWGSTLWEKHPEWFCRHEDGRFASPGAWGTVWEDLVELNPWIVPLWHELAAAFVTWCRRGVDAFRCDAGYKIPLPVWRFIIARVRQEFPDTLFLLEGLGGSWDATESLLREGGMQWAYSELFQNHGGGGVQWYLDHAYAMSRRAGPLIHYSETHDNLRLTCQPPGCEVLAASGRVTDVARRWSLFRNRLCALTSIAGGWGFTNGVEWLATERVNVHSARGLAWGSADHLLPELAALNRLVNDHPCFFADATLARISPDGSPVFALRRTSAAGHDTVLILANNELDRPHTFELDAALWKELGEPIWDLAASEAVQLTDLTEALPNDRVRLHLAPAACHCLSKTPAPQGESGREWREKQLRADWCLKVWVETVGIEPPEPCPPQWGASIMASDPVAWLTLASRTAHGLEPGATAPYPNVIRWSTEDARRITPVPPGHWILLCDDAPFRAALYCPGGDRHPVRVESIPTGSGYIAAISPSVSARATGRSEVELDRLVEGATLIRGSLLFLSPEPELAQSFPVSSAQQSLVLLTNDRGGMTRLSVDLGRIRSKYDCLLGANLHPTVPVDRHVFVKRLRAWAEVDSFNSPLDAGTLEGFEPGPPASWTFLVRGGNRQIRFRLSLNLLPSRNTVVIRGERLDVLQSTGAGADDAAGAGTDPGFRLIARFDLEDRNFHSETKCNGGADHHFTSNTHRLESSAGPGFRFQPAADRRLEIRADRGLYHDGPEWLHNIAHPFEASRGQEGSGDAWSPGWFEIPLEAGAGVTLVVDAELTPVPSETQQSALQTRPLTEQPADPFLARLTQAVRQFVVRRGDGRTVIAGYPWFLDWGRDTLIASRGLLAAGLVNEVRDILLTFARFEQGGTLPNAIHGEDASNRDTTDAPLWFGIVCEELVVATEGESAPAAASFFARRLADGRTVLDVLRSIACGYLRGTSNGIRVDHASGLVWSPSHFTWMDTNHPAGTPREGYPVEIQALWIRLLRLLARLGSEPWEGRGESWSDLARRTEKAFHQYFWLEECAWYADVLLASSGHPARTSPPSNALRSNCLLPVALGIDQHPEAAARARRTVEAARRWLLIPGALRSLAPLPVIPPLPVYGHHGTLLNDPNNPYWPRYEGDEDTRRKPAYHNGTAWGWTFPTFCEALVNAYPGDAWAIAAAQAYLSSIQGLLAEGCLGQLPEILDGDAPHTQRGCDAQAWSLTEAVRVWVWLRAQRERLGS